VNAQTDQQLLRDYAGSRSEAAFAELVRRHIDLVYSAALRMVGDSHQAEDVTQGVFVALAQNARQLTHHPVLSGWLHRTTQNLAANAVRTNVRRQTREQEAVVMNELLSAEPDTNWEHIAPHLDAALGELSEPDRDALLLRYFERKSAHEMAQTLGISDQAAQKRVNRAVERLREFFLKRGVTVGASGLVVFLSANAVHAAPVGLAVTVSATAGLAGTTIATTTTAAVTKAIFMTTLQKIIVGVALTAAIATGIYEARQASTLRSQIQTLEQSQSPLTAQIQQLQRERDDATNRLVALNEELGRWKSGQKQTELLKLRGQVGTLRQQLASTEAQSNSPSSGFAKMMSDPAMREYIHQAMTDLIKRRYGPMFQELKLSPEQIEKFVQVVSDSSQKGIQRLAAAQSGAAGPGEPGQTGVEEMKGLQEQLLSVLGESGAARFKEYSQEVPARATVDLLNGQLGGNKLSDEQSANLLKLVKAEPFDFTHGISGDLDQAFLGSQADIDNHLAKVTESNQRVVQQASSFLNADQVAALNTVLSNGITARVTQGAAFRPKP
jgi:RNA polymerase sigma factor (sigma-70 family)